MNQDNRPISTSDNELQDTLAELQIEMAGFKNTNLADEVAGFPMIDGIDNIQW